MLKVNKRRLKAASLKALGAAGAITLLTTLVAPSMASATSDVVAPGTSFTMTVPLQGTCSDATWRQVTPVDATTSIANDTLTLNWTNTAAIPVGADVRFTAQLNTQVEGCAMSKAATLLVNGAEVSPYQNALAPGGANLQVTWRAAMVETPSEPETPFDWNWNYPAPTCEGLSISFPSNLPSSQSGVMEVNVNGSGISGMNWKLEGSTYAARYPNGHAGATVVIPWNDPLWRNGSIPSSGEWSVTWVQVHGTNYHWQGEVTCGVKTPPKPEAQTGEDTTSTPAVCLAVGGGTVEETVTPWTREPTLDQATNTWVFGEKVYGSPVHSTREATGEECPPVEKPEAPKPQTVYTDWMDGELTCDSATVSQTRTATTTTYSVIPDGATWKVVETVGEPVVEHQTRQLTDEEAASCEKEEEPILKYAVFVAPVTIDVCGVEGDGIITAVSDHGTWSIAKTPASDDKTRHTVVFTPVEGYTVPQPSEADTYTIEEGVAVWTLYTSTVSSCGEIPLPPGDTDPTPPKDTVTPVVKPGATPPTAKVLATTGSETGIFGAVAALALLLGGSAILTVTQLRKRASVDA